tara:strand:- start:1371 stop:1748 length:378 start_codon:yes stop_codon:yes gene_type:complete
MSYFYYCVSGSNNDILQVREEWTSEMATKGWRYSTPSDTTGDTESGSRYLDSDNMYYNFTGSYVSKSLISWAPVWDEAKRCPFDLDEKPRYRYVDSTIQPNSNIENIHYNSGSLKMLETGVLVPK